ncbi:Lrp/AsnC ligand binding domain-containing protein [Lentzea albidocapillata]|uniref:Lrp/AsnC ligand binding domain-containing protein n=1 Tax=Lentzea albidocapillata TaxID=40571 RepID=UPI00068EB3F4
MNSRPPAPIIARKVGVAPSTCLERTRLLRERGVIRGYHADIAPSALNRGVQAPASVQVCPLSRTVIDAFKAFAAGLPEVTAVFMMAGSDDFVIHVSAQDNDRLHAFLVDKLSQRKEIVGFRTSIIFQHLAKHDPAPLPGA